jgi:hypothetical protein
MSGVARGHDRRGDNIRESRKPIAPLVKERAKLDWCKCPEPRIVAALGTEASLARISHRLTGQAHEGPAITSLRLLAVLNGL